MTEQTPTLTRHDLEAKIVKRCWEDEGFRKEFIADPVGAFGKYLEVAAASLPKILVHQEPAGSWHVVLPEKPPHENQLSEQDLERVAAGGITSYIGLVSAAGSILSAAGSASLSAGLVKGW